MSIETTRDNISVNHIIGQKTENFIAQGDSIIPDIKPDILNDIFTSGTVCIYKKEINEDKIRLDGGVNTYIVYQADDENNSVRSLNVNLDFTQMIDMENARPEMNLRVKVTLKNIECKVINGRKINVKAFIEAEVKISSNEDIQVINGVNLSGIQTLNKSLNVNSLVGRGMVRTYAKDTLVIDNIDNLSEIMKVDLNVSNKDIKVSYNKVLAKADLNVKILYLTEDNRINSVQSTIPVMSFIDIEDVTEDDSYNTEYEINNLVIKPNNIDEHSIYVEVELEVSCEVYKNQEINLIQDLYSPKTNVSFTQKQINVMERRENAQNTCNIRERQMLPEIGANKIYDVETSVNITKQTLLNDRILYEGEVTLNYIFNEGNGISTKKTTIPFNFSMDFKGVNPNSNITTNMENGTQDFVVTTDGEIEVKIDIMFNLKTKQIFQNTELYCLDFADFFKQVKLTSGDFVFLDPPYDTDFSDYENRQFNKLDQERLANELKKMEAKFILVIKNTDFIKSLYEKDFNILSFDNTYTYNVRGRNKRDVEHLIITNIAV